MKFRRIALVAWSLGIAAVVTLGFSGCGERAPERTRETAAPRRKDRPVPASLAGTPQGLVAAGDVEGVRAFLAKPQDDRDEQGRTLLHIAATHGRLGVAKLLLDAGADPRVTDSHGSTPLHEAAYAVHWIPPGAYRGMQLYPACGTEHEAVARLLIERGADLHARDDNRYTPLHLAAKGGNLAVARLLIERGADVRAADDDGTTPLHLAAMGGNHEPGLPQFTVPGEHGLVARLLLEKGANVDATSLMGTPLSEAVRSGSADIVQMLLAAGASPSSDAAGAMTVPPVLGAAYAGQIELLRSFLDAGAPVETRDSTGRTVLFMAALGGREAAVRLLLERGAKFDVRDASARTPLHAAAESGSVPTLNLLIERRGDARAVDADGWTLLHVAAAGCLADEAMLDRLLKEGLDIDARTKDGRTPRSLAERADCLIGNSPMATVLARRGAKR